MGLSPIFWYAFGIFNQLYGSSVLFLKIDRLNENALLSLLIAVNLAPLYGVLVWHWGVFELIVLYWIENIIFGVRYLVKLLINDYPKESRLTNLFTAVFFSLHYGMFTLVHGVFVFALFAPQGVFHPGNVAAVLIYHHIGKIVVIYLLWHLLYFLNEDSRSRGEHPIKSVMNEPYGRIIILHLTLIGGGFLVAALGEPIWALVLLSGLKIGFEIVNTLRQKTKRSVNG